MSKTTALAKADEKTTAMAAYDYGDFGGDGFENRGKDDISLPFLSILQPLSPQVAEGTVEGAKAGMFFNTVTGELDDSVRFIWCYDELKFVEWIPKDAGGGLVAAHDADAQVVRDAKAVAGPRSNKLKVGSNDLVETRYVYGLVLDDQDNIKGFAVIAAKSTNLKPVKDWFTATMMIAKGAPVYAFRSALTTTKQKNDKGTWFQLVAKPVGGSWKTSMINPATHRQLLEEAKSLKEMIVTGAAKVDYSAERAPGEEAAPGDQAVPF